MTVQVTISDGALAAASAWYPRDAGAVVTFAGVVRPLEAGQPIAGLRYEVYEPMASSELQRLAREAIERFDLLAVQVEHSRGMVPVHECSFRLGIGAAHREAAVEAVTWFVDAMKREVPIWKHPVPPDGGQPLGE